MEVGTNANTLSLKVIDRLAIGSNRAGLNRRDAREDEFATRGQGRLAASKDRRDSILMATPRHLSLAEGRGVGGQALYQLMVAIDIEALQKTVARVVADIVEEEAVEGRTLGGVADGEILRARGHIEQTHPNDCPPA